MYWCVRSSLVLLILSMVVISASPEPRAAIHVRYSAPAHIYSGSFRVRDSSGISDNTLGSDPEAMWPVGVFLPPQTWEEPWPSPGSKFSARTGSDPSDYDDDPLLLSDEDARAFLRYMFARGELFFRDIPHARAVLRNQEERRANGLAGNRLGSNRPESPFYLWRRRRSPRRRRQ